MGVWRRIGDARASVLWYSPPWLLARLWRSPLCLRSWWWRNISWMAAPFGYFEGISQCVASVYVVSTLDDWVALSEAIRRPEAPTPGSMVSMVTRAFDAAPTN